MTYETTTIKPSDGATINKRLAIKASNTLNTSTLIWLLVKRHRVALLATWAIAVTTVQVFPFVPSLLASLVK